MGTTAKHQYKVCAPFHLIRSQRALKLYGLSEVQAAWTLLV